MGPGVMTVLLWAVGACAIGDVDTPVRPASAQRIEVAHGFYWLVTPPGMRPDTRYPLVVCLHGTETRATDILNFWRSLQPGLPLIFVAPQGLGAGWRDTDLPMLHELCDQIADTIPCDPERILLTGHSAGGAMAFHLLYVEAFAASAVAVTANYMPPTVTAQQVERHSDVPLFYAVGEADINRPRMRRGLELLRGAGAQVTVRRPPIGHTLSREMGQAAMDWFMSQCRLTVDRRLDQARSVAEAGDRADPGLSAAGLEGLLRNRAGHFPDQVAQAGAPRAQLLEHQADRRGSETPPAQRGEAADGEQPRPSDARQELGIHVPGVVVHRALVRERDRPDLLAGEPAGAGPQVAVAAPLPTGKRAKSWGHAVQVRQQRHAVGQRK